MAALQRPDVVLPIEHWPAQGIPRARVLVVHGLGEHPGRYEALAAQLVRWGLDVRALHLRGHGRASGSRGDAPSATAMLEDVAAAIDAVREPGRPFVLLGHSLGGLLAARVVAGALRGEPFGREPDWLVLSSPALDPGMRWHQHLLLAVGRRFLPHMGASNGLKPAWISRDPAVVKLYQQDPMVHGRVTPTVAQMVVEGGEVVQAEAPRWRVPTLLLWAGADRCVAPRGSQAFADAAPPAWVQARRFDHLAHEIFNEPERAEVLAVLKTALDHRFPEPTAR
ncbi:MAG: lysophospholipase [Inhella sp.]|jgi:alpha-beta hydrolase superfamily lysophospholipase|uniref:alpha/beta hydrolase n=1 Tax=Inhella sp. TaxID=1921806 RepID=UPI0022C15D79|nr:alpha/beta hydrolase [Inhella sp.]MCZ8235684.1 lysophospholipase [Inhella sp.]